ncbi:hypothetical protein [Halorussus amylolyticus]|uniref:hypothetical protein n=1 Tax=Halorussus amylolyticus TaxID=1126242 RepID=UPI00104A5215|nr:hypothetical protein [Halorussus amylolyticus]
MTPVRTAVALLALVGFGLVVGLPGSIHHFGSATESGTSPPADALVEPRENASLLWPYTSKSRSVEDRTLAINLVIHGGQDEVRRSLADQTGLEWNRTDDNETEADASTHSVVVTDDGFEWSSARGSTRYTYIDAGPHGGPGMWKTPDYQLHSGNYLGTRQHIRAYNAPNPDDDWTALQAHGEYWDWFRLRHTVTSVQGSARIVESEFLDEPYVSEVRREYHGNRGGGNDGWITAVELALAGIVVGLSFGRALPDSVEQARSEAEAVFAKNGKRVLLPGSLAALYLGVRTAGVALEGVLPTTSPKVFAGVLYPVLAFGIPLVAARASRPLGRTMAFTLAVVGLGAAFVLDFSALGVNSVSIRLAVHRVALLVSVGLVAAGCARRDGAGEAPLVALGAVFWVLCLLLPLLGML